MDYRELLTVALDFATAILLGALVGIEREKRKSEEDDTHHIAGLRTFILLALFGAAAGCLSRSLSAPWIFAAALLIVGAFVVAGYYVTAQASQNGKGLTTEIAAVVVFLLGAMVMSATSRWRSGSASSPPPCSPTSSRCMASWRSSAGTTSMPACGC